MRQTTTLFLCIEHELPAGIPADQPVSQATRHSACASELRSSTALVPAGASPFGGGTSVSQSAAPAGWATFGDAPAFTPGGAQPLALEAPPAVMSQLQGGPITPQIPG